MKRKNLLLYYNHSMSRCLSMAVQEQFCTYVPYFSKPATLFSGGRFSIFAKTPCETIITFFRVPSTRG